MNLKDSMNLLWAVFAGHVARQKPSKHSGSKPPRESDAAIRARRKRQRRARKVQRRRNAA